MGNYISSENKYWIKRKGIGFLRQDIFLKHLSVINDDTVTITVQRDHTVFEVEVVLANKEEIQLLNPTELKSGYSWDIKDNLNIAYFNIEESKIDYEFEAEVSRFFEEINKANIDYVVGPFVQYYLIRVLLNSHKKQACS